MSPAEVTEKLGLHRMRDRSWYVHPRYVRSVFRSALGYADDGVTQLRSNGRRPLRGPSVALAQREEATAVIILAKILLASLVSAELVCFFLLPPYAYPVVSSPCWFTFCSSSCLHMAYFLSTHIPTL